MEPHRFECGDRVIIDDRALAAIVNGNRSIKVHPCDRFVALAQELHAAGTKGTVSHVFRPGYDVTVDFVSISMHMQCHWIAPA